MSRPDLWQPSNEWTNNPGYFNGHPETECEFLYACGRHSKDPDQAQRRIWRIRGWDFDIKAYRVTKRAGE